MTTYEGVAFVHGGGIVVIDLPKGSVIRIFLRVPLVAVIAGGVDPGGLVKLFVRQAEGAGTADGDGIQKGLGHHDVVWNWRKQKCNENEICKDGWVG